METTPLSMSNFEDPKGDAGSNAPPQGNKPPSMPKKPSPKPEPLPTSEAYKGRIPKAPDPKQPQPGQPKSPPKPK